jgi:Prenyltransferase and squalene oxidase repeat
MRTLGATLFALVATGFACADEPAKPPDLQTTIDSGLAFLAKDAVAWKEKHNCASCHHAALTIWALREAKDRGHAIDETVLADLTKWVAEVGDGKNSLPRPDSAPRAFHSKALYFSLGLATLKQPSDAERQGRQRLLATVLGDQLEDGSWSSWPDTRPPIFGNSDETVTALAGLALSPEVAAGDAASATARERALKWLAEHEPSGDHQALTLRLLLLRRADRPEVEWQPLAKQLVGRQNADGGWSQTPEMVSDAHATGQALYALAHAGRDATDSVIQRGQAFLIKTQDETGSWKMTSREIKPGDGGAKSLVPITGAGNAWAILGLVANGK